MVKPKHTKNKFIIIINQTQNQKRAIAGWVIWEADCEIGINVRKSICVLRNIFPLGKEAGLGEAEAGLKCSLSKGLRALQREL